MEFRIKASVDIFDLADDLAMELDEDALVEFIIGIDSARCDWTLTEKLYKYFKKEHRYFKDEVEH